MEHWLKLEAELLKIRTRVWDFERDNSICTHCKNLLIRDYSVNPLICTDPLSISCLWRVTCM